MAAKQGAHSRLNTRNENALSGVNTSRMFTQICQPFSATSSNPPKSTPNVPTTFSLAIRPVTDATAPCQWPQPSGANRNATALPIAARMLWSISTMPKLPSCQPKDEVNQTKIVARRMIVPAFLMNDQPRSHIERRMLPTVGQ